MGVILKGVCETHEHLGAVPRANALWYGSHAR